MWINKTICPESEVGLILEASDIPDGGTVSKRAGEKRYVMRHPLVLYSAPGSDAKPVTVEGYFLVSPEGTIGQVHPGASLIFWARAEDLVEAIQHSWEEDR